MQALPTQIRSHPYRQVAAITILVLLGSAPLVAQHHAVQRIPISGRASLGELIQDRNTPMEMRRTALRRLRQLSNEYGAEKIPAAEFYRPIIKALDIRGKENASLRETACEELSHFGKQSGGEISGALGRVFRDKNEDLKVRNAAGRSLGYMRGDPSRATGPLVNILNGEIRRGPTPTNIGLVRTAIESLKRLGQASARASLLNVLESDFADDIKASARGALESLPAEKNKSK